LFPENDKQFLVSLPNYNNVFLTLKPLFFRIIFEHQPKEPFKKVSAAKLQLKWPHPKWSSNHRWAIPALKVARNDELNHELYTFRVALCHLDSFKH